MEKSLSVQVRNLRLLTWATYLGLTVMAVIGLAGLSDARARGLALTLCVAFGLIYALTLRIVRTTRQVNVYFAAQTLLVCAVLSILNDNTGTFSFFFIILGVQAAMLLSERTAIFWLALFYLITSFIIVAALGAAGLINILFNAAAYGVVGLLIHTFHQAELARRQSQVLLEELRAAHSQLQDFTEQAKQLAVVNERTRLARELHDSLGHRLTVAVVQLEGAQRLIPLKPEQAAQMIITMREELKIALADLRMTVSAMRSPIDEGQSLNSLLENLCQTFGQKTGLVTHFVASEIPPLSESYRLVLYRAVQEGLTNIQRHAEACNAWIRLDGGHEKISLTIEDDGKGIEEVAEKESGMGLSGIRERVNELGGEMRISLRTNGGTLLAINIPLPRQDMHD